MVAFYERRSGYVVTRKSVSRIQWVILYEILAYLHTKDRGSIEQTLVLRNERPSLMFTVILRLLFHLLIVGLDGVSERGRGFGSDSETLSCNQASMVFTIDTDI